MSAAVYYKINHQILAKEVRLLADDGTQIGVLPIAEARAKAQELGVDLVEIASTANPPVVKAIDYKKFKYQLAKKEAQEKKKQKGGELKSVRFSPFMAENDFQTRLKRVIEFLKQNNKVRLELKFKSMRLISKREFGFEVLNKAAKATADIAAVDQAPKMLGKVITMTLTPVKKKQESQPKVEK